MLKEEIIKEMSNNAYLNIDEDMKEVSLKINKLITKIKKIEEFSFKKDIKPLSYVYEEFDESSSWRDDEIIEDELSEEEILKNAKEVMHKRVKVTKVVG